MAEFTRGATGLRRIDLIASAPDMTATAAPLPGMIGQEAAPCGGAWGRRIKRSRTRELSLSSTALDAGEPHPSEVYESEAGAAAPNDGGDTELIVGGDVADCGFWEVLLPVKTAPTLIMAEYGAYLRHYLVEGIVAATLGFTPKLLRGHPRMGLSEQMMATRGTVLPPKGMFLEQVMVGGVLRWSGLVSSESKTTSIIGMVQQGLKAD